MSARCVASISSTQTEDGRHCLMATGHAIWSVRGMPTMPRSTATALTDGSDHISDRLQIRSSECKVNLKTRLVLCCMSARCVASISSTQTEITTPGWSSLFDGNGPCNVELAWNAHNAKVYCNSSHWYLNIDSHPYWPSCQTKKIQIKKRSDLWINVEVSSDCIYVLRRLI